MHVHFLGNLEERYLTGVLLEVEKLIKIPTDLHLYFLKNMADCYDIEKKLPKIGRSSFRRACTEKVSFSYSCGKKRIVVIYMKPYLKEKNALIGLLLHEIMHSHQRRKGLYKKSDKAFRKFWKAKYFKGYSKRELSHVYENIGENVRLFLRDLHDNTEILGKGYGKYLLAWYESQLMHKKNCPRPKLYDKFKSAIRKNLKVLETTLIFELALLSIVLPFQHYASARKLLKHIEKCYEVNLKEISRKCRDMVEPYYDHYYSKTFDEKLIKSMISKVYELLE